VMQSRKLTVNGVTQSTASARRPISSLPPPPQSESGTGSTAQLPQGVDPPAQHTSEAHGHPYSLLPRLKSSKSGKSRSYSISEGPTHREYPTRRMQLPPHKPLDAGPFLGPIPPAQVERVITGKVPRIPRSEPVRVLQRGRVDGSGNSTHPSASDNSASTSRLAGRSGGGTNSVTSSKPKGKETGAGESKEPGPKQRWR
jgi:hypothetical protein